MMSRIGKTGRCSDTPTAVSHREEAEGHERRRAEPGGARRAQPPGSRPRGAHPERMQPLAPDLHLREGADPRSQDEIEAQTPEQSHEPTLHPPGGAVVGPREEHRINPRVDARSIRAPTTPARPRRSVDASTSNAKEETMKGIYKLMGTLFVLDIGLLVLSGVPAFKDASARIQVGARRDRLVRLHPDDARADRARGDGAPAPRASEHRRL